MQEVERISKGGGEAEKDRRRETGGRRSVAFDEISATTTTISAARREHGGDANDDGPMACSSPYLHLVPPLPSPHPSPQPLPLYHPSSPFLNYLLIILIRQDLKHRYQSPTMVCYFAFSSFLLFIFFCYSSWFMPLLVSFSILY